MCTVINTNSTIPVIQWEDRQRPIAAKCGFEHNQAMIKVNTIAISTIAFALGDINMLFMELYRIEYPVWTGINTFLTTCASFRIPDNDMFMP